jgi:hypothetical protein
MEVDSSPRPAEANAVDPLGKEADAKARPQKSTHHEFDRVLHVKFPRPATIDATLLALPDPVLTSKKSLPLKGSEMMRYKDQKKRKERSPRKKERRAQQRTRKSQLEC